MSTADGRKGPLTLDEFHRQLQELLNMGPPAEILKLLPGEIGRLAGDIDEDELRNSEAILTAMTPEERHDPDLLIEEPRRLRIAAGAGRPVEEVNSLIAQFYQARRFISGREP